MKFIDEAVITIKAGDGGRGAVSFRREKFVPFGGPDGGDGGRGGHVILVADPSMTTLLDFKYKPLYRAKRGGNGQTADKHGADGVDVIIGVPCGTMVIDDATGELLADLVEAGVQFRAAKGGRGGKGNTAFKTSTNQAPRKYQPGEPGEEGKLRLELRLIADVGLVGLPNAGKSTLISRISAARPKIADYPFTTLVPNLGVVRHPGHDFVVADLPGLIAGASAGHGLGHQFLRHVERTRLILHLLDCQSEDPMADLAVIDGELETFDPELARRPRILVITKADVTDPAELGPLRQSLERAGRPALIVSAVSGYGLEELVAETARQLSALAPAPAVKEEWAP
jgi:GTPase